MVKIEWFSSLWRQHEAIRGCVDTNDVKAETKSNQKMNIYYVNDDDDHDDQRNSGRQMIVNIVNFIIITIMIIKSSV